MTAAPAGRPVAKTGVWGRRLVKGALAIFVLIQAVPYGRDHGNPSVRAEPAWDSPRTRELAARACFDCHSNETIWPWYANLAPVSWLVQRDVKKGRRELNFSEWDKAQKEARELAKEVRKGKMPPWYYPWGRLSAADREELIRGLEATLGRRPPEPFATERASPERADQIKPPIR